MCTLLPRWTSRLRHCISEQVTAWLRQDDFLSTKHRLRQLLLTLSLLLIARKVVCLHLRKALKYLSPLCGYQRELKLSVVSFPQTVLVGRDSLVRGTSQNGLEAAG